MRLNSSRNHVFFSLLSAMPSGRVRRKRVFAFDCLSRCGSCARVQALSSSGESVFFISESLAASHSASSVQMSSILLFAQSFPMESSPLRDGKLHPFGAAVAMPD